VLELVGYMLEFVQSTFTLLWLRKSLYAFVFDGILDGLIDRGVEEDRVTTREDCA
jgi:hypothetical protein